MKIKELLSLFCLTCDVREAGGCPMGKEKTYTLTLSGQELHDLIEAALVCECQAAQIINGLKRKGLDMDAQKLVTQNARLARLVRRMQDTKEETNG